MGKKKTQEPSLSSTEKEPVNAEQQKVIDWLKKVRFRKQLFGGISEADVWKKLDELNKLYDAALAAERVRYDTLLNEYKSGNGPAESEGGDE